MNWVDYAILVVLAVSTIAGLWRGFTREIFSLATWIAAFWLAWRFGPALASHLGHFKFGTAGLDLRLYAGYALVFIAVILVGALVAALFVKWVRSGPLVGPDRSLGAALGVLRGLLIVVVAIMLAGVGGERSSVSWRHSALIPRLSPVAEALRGWIPPDWLAPLTDHGPTSSPITRTDR